MTIIKKVLLGGSSPGHIPYSGRHDIRAFDGQRGREDDHPLSQEVIMVYRLVEAIKLPVSIKVLAYR